jgi:NAD(P)-dependent dehydrogenase (short-subunit alcohol dehydrogenase family)
MSISDFSLEGKKAVVVGGKQGLGKAYALTFAEAGADVAIADLDVGDGLMDSVAEEIQKLGRQSLAVKTDISKKTDIDNLIQKVMDKFGTIDIWVNVAVKYHSAGLLELSEEDWDTLTDTNLKGYWLACQAVAPIMIERKKGSIINMTSQAGLRAFKPDMLGNYGITKAGIVMLTKQLALALAQHNVRVNAIALSVVKQDPKQNEENANAPAWDKTNPELLKKTGGLKQFFDQSAAGIPMGRNAEPSEIANGALYLASDASSYVTGHVLVIDGGNIV